MNTQINVGVKALVDSTTLEPNVTVSIGSSSIKLSVAQAVEFSIAILDGAQTAMGYAFVAGFIHKQLYVEGSKPDPAVMRDLIQQMTQFMMEQKAGKKIGEVAEGIIQPFKPKVM